jgi:hypothetical protein
MKSFEEAFDKFTPITGGNIEVLESLHRTIGKLSSNCQNYYIGITSNGKEGCRSRWNSKYKNLNFPNQQEKILTIQLEVVEEVQEVPYVVYFAYKK